MLLEGKTAIVTGASGGIGKAIAIALAKENAAKAVSSLGTKGIIEFIKTLMLKSYGVKSEDGRTFIKNEKVREEFQYGGAFSAIAVELMTDDEAASEFVNKIISAKLAAKLADAISNKTKGTPESV